ncbi:hypothetical protein EVAR_29600_1 [Eumeta japonica]|uniref:Uncharacterized protein n=1 Tax=Eumeta variegata TaxID=151549 RepID=A0A4C1VUE9_EUMVA|nr:hypothetical protein EVAR_29600_1 [Eumeta japonica]
MKCRPVPVFVLVFYRVPVKLGFSAIITISKFHRDRWWKFGADPSSLISPDNKHHEHCLSLVYVEVWVACNFQLSISNRKAEMHNSNRRVPVHDNGDGFGYTSLSCLLIEYRLRPRCDVGNALFPNSCLVRNEAFTHCKRYVEDTEPINE